MGATLPQKQPPPKPLPFSVETETIPLELKEGFCFVGWCWELKENKRGELKWSKPPYNPHRVGAYAQTNNPSTMSGFDKALQGHKDGKFDGVGRCFSKDDILLGIDLDHCRTNGKLAPWATEIVEKFDSYTEITPSGTGYRVWVIGKKPGPRSKQGDVEIYDSTSTRFLTITGHLYDGTPRTIEHRQDAIDWFYEKYFPEKTAPSPQEKPVISQQGTDAEIIQKAISSKNGHKFELLNQGLWEEAGYLSQSEADQAFCNLLAFWTGRDLARMDAIFRQSGLVRPKWDTKHYGDGRTYGQATIEQAIAGCHETYTDKRQPLEFIHPGPPPEADEPYNGCSDTDEAVEGIPQKKNSSDETKIKIVSIESIANTEINDKPIITGLFGEKESLIISAASGTGKSLLVNNIALNLANPSANGLWRLFDVPHAVKTLIIQSENGLNAFNKRLNKLFDAYPEMRKGAKNVYTVKTGNDCRITGSLTDKKFQKFLVDSLVSVGAKILILDPLISFHGEDENDNAAMRRSLDCLSAICEEANASVIICHHYNRANLTRGAASIRDWASNMLLMDFERWGHDGSAILKITHDKSRNYEQQPDFYLERTPDLNFLRCEKPDSKQSTQIEAVVAALTEMGGNINSQAHLKKAVMVELNCSEATSRRAINEALEMRKIIIIPGEGKAYSYALSE